MRETLCCATQILLLDEFVASARSTVGRQSCPMLTPFRNYLNQASAVSQPIPGLPQKQRALPKTMPLPAWPLYNGWLI